MKYFFACLLSCFLIFTGCSATGYNLDDGLYALLKTEKGDIVISLAYKKTPVTVLNFAGLAEGKFKTSKEEGVRFYDGLTFHRVVKDPPFVIQGGCPAGDGTGNPGYTFPDEFHPELRHDSAGIVSMANSGPDSNGSQFFITLTATPHLNDRHSVFGEVVEGMDVVESIEEGDAIKEVTILKVGEEAENFEISQAAFSKELTELKARLVEEREEARKETLVFIQEQWPEAIQNEYGLWKLVQEEGSGERPESGDTVEIHYKARFLDGRVFDNSRERGKALQFILGANQVLPAWELGLADMRIGEKTTFISPPELAFGSKGAGNGLIPPNTFLIFDIELLSVSAGK